MAILEALLLADFVYDDLHTRKKILAGVFNTIGVLELPQKVPCGWLFASVRDIDVGKYDATVIVLKEGSETVIFKADIGINVRVEKLPFEIHLPMPEVEFISEGVHLLQFFFDGKLLGSKSFSINKIEIAAPKDKE
ncbi:MAG: hypothetical protein V3V10_03430 [Planctomycetota bacterium]